MRKKSSLSSLEKFGIYSSFFISLLALVFSAFSFYYDNILSKKESIVILDASGAQYFFDGESLVRNVSLSVYNNSRADVSITTLKVVVENESHRFDSADNPILPINLSSNHTEQITIPLPVEMDKNDVNFISKKYGTNCTIDPYELEMYLETGRDIKNTNNITLTPGIQITLYTAKGSVAEYKRNGGASG